MKNCKCHCHIHERIPIVCGFFCKHCTQEKTDSIEKKIEELRELRRQAGYEPNAWYEDKEEKFILSLLQEEKKRVVGIVEGFRETLNGANPNHKIFNEEFSEEQELLCRIGALTILKDILEKMERGEE